MATLFTSKSTAHPGFTWLAMLDRCGCATIGKRPIADHVVEQAVALMTKETIEHRMEMPPRDEPIFPLSNEAHR